MAAVDAAAPPSPAVAVGPGVRRGELSLQELMTALRDETVHVARHEMAEMSDVITDGVTDAAAKVLDLEPAYVASASASASLDKRGLPRMDVIKAPLPQMPYMMEPEREPMYAIRAFTPLWKELKLERNAFTTVIQGLRVMVSKWNHNEDKGETHVALNQGKLHVPWGKATKLLHAGLAAALQTGSECWITEIKTLWYRYFTDLDFVQPEKLAPRQIEALVLVVQRAVRRFFPGKHADDPLFYAIVCSTSYKPVFASKDDERLYTIGVEARKKLEAPGPHLSDALAKELSAKIAAMPANAAWKTGVHIIWVNLYVNNAMALYMRETIIYDLADTFGVRAEPMNDWMDVVDVTVYKKSGLRMVGNRKSDPCSQCKGAHRVGPPPECAYCAENKHHCTVKVHWVRLKKADVEAKLGDVCPTCDGNGRVDTGRPYMPMFVVDSQGYRRPELEDVYRRDFVRLINDTAIRWRGVPWRDSSRAERDRAKLRGDMAAHDEEEVAAAAAALEATNALTYVYEQPRGQGWAVYKGAPQPVSLKLVTGADGLEHYVEEEADLSKAVSRKKKAAGGAGAGEEDATAKALAGASEPKGMNIVLLRTDPLAATLQDFIRANAGTLHCELAVTRVATNRDRTAYFVNVHGPNCHYCHNVGREHGSNRIYFMFTNDGMWQRCHKRGPRTAEMKYSACESYRSAPVTLPQDLRAALFPHVAAKLSAMGVSASRGYGGTTEDAAADAAAAAGDVATATQYDPTRDIKTNTLMDVGDVLAMQVHSTAWSPTLKMPDGRHMARTRTHAVDAEFVARSAMLMTGGVFVSVNFADLGQNAADAMQRLGFGTADDMPALAPTPTPTPSHTHAGAAGGAGDMLSSLSDALAGSYDEDAPASALAPSAAIASSTKASGAEEKPRLSIQRLHALLLRQVAAVIDAAVALPSATVTECIATGGMSAVVDAFRVQRRARPIVMESMDARIARIAAAAADALDEGKGRDLAVWMSAIEECRTARDKEQVCDAAARWRMYWEAHPDGEPHAAAAHVRTRGAVPCTKRKRDEGVRPAAVVRAPTGPRFKSLREVKDN